MACPNRNRQRPRTIAFRCTDEEFEIIDQRIKVTGEIKGDYLREVVLKGEVQISVGKFKSDKLAFAIKNLTEELERVIEEKSEDEFKRLLNEIHIMLKEMYPLVVTEKNELI